MEGLNELDSVAEEHLQATSLLVTVKNSIVHYIFEKPVGIGLWVGLVMGALNGYMYALPMLESMVAGGVLGAIICIATCPEMRTMLKERRNRIRRERMDNVVRSRALSAFTSLE